MIIGMKVFYKTYFEDELNANFKSKIITNNAYIKLINVQGQNVI